WTAADVVQNFSAHPDTAACFASETVRQTFLDNVIDGAVLLSKDFTHEVLKQELGIKQFGHRVKILQIAEALRHKYEGYNEQKQREILGSFSDLQFDFVSSPSNSQLVQYPQT